MNNSEHGSISFCVIWGFSKLIVKCNTHKIKRTIKQNYSKQTIYSYNQKVKLFNFHPLTTHHAFICVNIKQSQICNDWDIWIGQYVMK